MFDFNSFFPLLSYFGWFFFFLCRPKTITNRLQKVLRDCYLLSFGLLSVCWFFRLLFFFCNWERERDESTETQYHFRVSWTFLEMQISTKHSEFRFRPMNENHIDKPNRSHHHPHRKIVSHIFLFYGHCVYNVTQC